MGKRRRTKTSFGHSLLYNNKAYRYYYDTLSQIAVSRFRWINLPDGIDERFLELTLMSNGVAVFYYDDILEKYLCLSVLLQGDFDVYRIPRKRTAFAVGGYQHPLNEKDSVLIYSNYLHTTPMRDIEMFAERMYNIDRTSDVNINAQKTPVMILSDENQRLTMKNLYMQWEGNEPVIFGDKKLNMNDIKALRTDAPFVADRLQQLKNEIWNEALTYLGISNTNTAKKERLISDEVTRNMGGVIANRFSSLEMRKQACKQINDMFGLNIDVEFREDYRVLDGDMMIQNGVIEDTLPDAGGVNNE